MTPYGYGWNAYMALRGRQGGVVRGKVMPSWEGLSAVERGYWRLYGVLEALSAHLKERAAR